MIITDEKLIFNSILLALQKKLSLKPSISSKDSDSNFCHDHINIEKIKEVYPEIGPNNLNQFLKGMLKILKTI